ncbi:hypothetical protein KQX54_006718 [Cotesia glomerata]|uniref:Uncharacterized protein n=1 Tax=Cotesia glomerata TaxID=32391 RepID=A0AAV7HWJ3_COTGL|nr:hypothetical protein KQX54_006718 [Cotesia glomerata]
MRIFYPIWSTGPPAVAKVGQGPLTSLPSSKQLQSSVTCKSNQTVWSLPLAPLFRMGTLTICVCNAEHSYRSTLRTMGDLFLIRVPPAVTHAFEFRSR